MQHLNHLDCQILALGNFLYSKCFEKHYYEFGEKKYLKFNDLTVVPIQRKLILEEMLSEEETKWVNEYHAIVWERLNNDLSGSTKEWLKRQTAPI
jgi:Xaa-Pro aminopeptidase